MKSRPKLYRESIPNCPKDSQETSIGEGDKATKLTAI